MLADLRKSEGLDYGGSPVPLFGKERATWGGSHMLCMPARILATKARAAWRLLKYLSDHSLEWADGGQVPVRNSLRDSARFRGMTVQSAFATQLSYVKYDPPTIKATEMGPFVDAAVEAALLGIEPPEKAMSDCAARVDRVLARP
jgi:multiple sugar transport system substrate-binding protein